MAEGRGKTGQTVWNSLHAANWSKNEDDEQSRQFMGELWSAPILYSADREKKGWQGDRDTKPLDTYLVEFPLVWHGINQFAG